MKRYGRTGAVLLSLFMSAAAPLCAAAEVTPGTSSVPDIVSGPAGAFAAGGPAGVNAPGGQSQAGPGQTGPVQQGQVQAGPGQTGQVQAGPGQTGQIQQGGAAGPDMRLGPGIAGLPEAAAAQQTELFGGGQLAMLAGQNVAQMLSCLLQSAEGGLVVVDGGWTDDADHLLQAIADRGGRVDAWLLTHPDPDHAGALYDIVAREGMGGITISHIYCSLGLQEWYDTHTPDIASFVGILRDRLGGLPQGVVVDPIGAGTEIWAPGIRTVVLNNAEFGDSNTANSTGVVYRCEMNGVRILFLGDLDEAGGERLLRQTAAEELRADIVQMAHHGQDGVGRSVYQAAGARICLWPTPEWLWNNDNGGGMNSGPWRTLETRAWMRDLGVGQNFVAKDGDIILR